MRGWRWQSQRRPSTVATRPGARTTTPGLAEATRMDPRGHSFRTRRGPQCVACTERQTPESQEPQPLPEEPTGRLEHPTPSSRVAAAPLPCGSMGESRLSSFCDIRGWFGCGVDHRVDHRGRLGSCRAQVKPMVHRERARHAPPDPSPSAHQPNGRPRRAASGTARARLAPGLHPYRHIRLRGPACPLDDVCRPLGPRTRRTVGSGAWVGVRGRVGD